MITVLHVLPSLGREGQLGGAERIVVNLIRWLREQPGLNIQLCVLGHRDPWFRSYRLADEPIFLEQQYLPLRIGAFVSLVRQLGNVLCEFRPDIVHSHLWPADMVVAASMRSKNICHVAHIHDAWVLAGGHHWRHIARRALYRLLLRKSRARFVACADAVKHIFTNRLRFKASRITVIYNGIEPSWLAEQPSPPPSAGEFVVGYAARLQQGKAQDVLIRAVAQLSRKVSNIRLLLAGGGSPLEHYRQCAAEAGISDRVAFPGRVLDMKSFYDHLDVYAMSSRSEGLPVSILEAMARARPVVATRVGGVPEMITNGVEGLLVPPDDPDTLAEALGRLASDEQLRAEMGRAGWSRVRKQFLLPQMTEKIANYYRHLVA